LAQLPRGRRPEGRAKRSPCRVIFTMITATSSARALSGRIPTASVGSCELAVQAFVIGLFDQICSRSRLNVHIGRSQRSADGDVDVHAFRSVVVGTGAEVADQHVLACLETAHLERFMTPPESVLDTDVVVWYAAHYVHDAGIEVGNWVGPDLVPTGW
jgi:hypothetical protein